MADRTAQPPSGVGINPALSSSARFLWNGAEPDKNQIGGANSTTGLRGTTVAGGADGQYQRYDNTTGAQLFNITAPTGAYTAVIGLVFPAASVAPYTRIFHLAGGGGFRVECQTTGGGVYIKITHTATGASVNEFVTGVGGFDSEMWTYVARYNGTTLVQYLKRGDGSTATTTTETIGYTAPSGSQIGLGSSDGFATQGVYAAALFNGDLGDTEALALRDNIWRAFAPEASADTTPPTLTGTVTASSITTTTATISWPAGSDNVAVTSYERSINGGAYVDVGNVTSVGLTGLTASTAYTITVRAKDAAGNVSTPAISGTFTTSAALPAPGQPGAMTAPVVQPVAVQVTFGTATDAVTYEMRIKQGAGAFGSWVTGLTTPVNIFTGLVIGDTYTVECVGRNATGVSATARGGTVTVSSGGVTSSGSDFAAALLMAWS